MFWGLIMEPNKRYTQTVEKPFHISQAAMDISTGDNDPCQVMVVVDGKNYLVCTLQKNKGIQVPLDLYFKSGDSISFLTNGKCNVHLTGYLDPEFEDDESDEDAEEEEEEEEAPELVPAKNKRKLENSNDTVTSKKAKQDKKPANKKVAAAEDSDDSDELDEDEKNQLQKFLDGEEIDTDDNDESFKVNTSGEADSDDESGEEEEEEDDDDEEAEAEEAEDDDSEEAETTLDTSKEEKQLDLSKLSKSQKRRLKKQQKKQQEQTQVNGVDKAKKAEPVKADKKEAKKQNGDATPAEKKEKKNITGGVSIEDLKVGAGPVAKPGKIVQVYYEGRLKSNNKMFDNCLKGSGFKFRLGAKEVITGWDVGVAGMKVGGKRKIVCPPAMAYGAKGSPPVIPPNSTLVFEVELKNVK